jgi:peptidoglycan/xylan/chitin deacetylase (PgdA/CDA1 family)
MILLHNIGVVNSKDPSILSNYNAPDEVLNAKEQLSFDGVYLNVWENRHLLAHRTYKPFLFVMGNFVGLDNSFDVGMPREKYCDWNQIMDLVINYNCELGWHTWTHRNLCDLNDDQIIKEVTPPFPMKYFAYPYGNVDERVERIVRSIGCYSEAFSVTQGNNNQFQRKRRYL